MKIFEGNSISEVYEDALTELQISPIIGNTREINNAIFVIHNPTLKNKNIKDIRFDTIAAIHPKDIEEYQRYLELNIDSLHYHKNGKKSIARKMAPLRGMYKYLVRNLVMAKKLND